MPLGEQEFFRETSWAAIFGGLGIIPETHHPGVHNIGDDKIAAAFQEFADYVSAAARQAPIHDAFFEGPAKAPATP